MRPLPHLVVHLAPNDELAGGLTEYGVVLALTTHFNKHHLDHVLAERFHLYARGAMLLRDALNDTANCLFDDSAMETTAACNGTFFTQSWARKSFLRSSPV